MVRTLSLLLIVFSLALFGSMLLGCAPVTHASSVVKVNVGLGHGSGVHIGGGLVLTAAHVTTQFGNINVTDDGGAIHKAERMWANPAFDVALVKMETHRDVAVSQLECEPSPIGSKVRGVGFPMDLGVVHVWGLVSSDAREMGPWRLSQSTDMSILNGQSGGPVFNEQGSVVGFMIGYRGAMNGSWTAFSMMVPAKAACDLLGWV